MNDTEIRIAIAQAMGWEWTGVDGGEFTELRHWRLPASKNSLENKCLIELPDYTNDLNAMHQAWRTLFRRQAIHYSQNLRIVVVNSGIHTLSSNEDIVACCENATARQRSEAFLRTIGRWRD